jgi:hypothetical protein
MYPDGYDNICRGIYQATGVLGGRVLSSEIITPAGTVE